MKLLVRSRHRGSRWIRGRSEWGTEFRREQHVHESRLCFTLEQGALPWHRRPSTGGCPLPAPGLLPWGFFPTRVLPCAPWGPCPSPGSPGPSVLRNKNIPPTFCSPPQLSPAFSAPRWHRYRQQVCACSGRSPPAADLSVQISCPGSGFGCCSPMPGCQGPSAPVRDVRLRTRETEGPFPGSRVAWSTEWPGRGCTGRQWPVAAPPLWKSKEVPSLLAAGTLLRAFLSSWPGAVQSAASRRCHPRDSGDQRTETKHPSPRGSSVCRPPAAASGSVTSQGPRSLLSLHLGVAG